MNRPLLIALVATILVHLIIWTSTMNSEEEKREEAHYITMVCTGAWPDYKHKKPEC